MDISGGRNAHIGIRGGFAVTADHFVRTVSQSPRVGRGPFTCVFLHFSHFTYFSVASIVYKTFLSLGQFIPKYFIIFDAPENATGFYPRPATSASLGNLVEMQILRTHGRKERKGNGTDLFISSPVSLLLVNRNTADFQIHFVSCY